MPRSRGRTGRPWRRVRARILADSQTCWLCGHPIDLGLPVTHAMSATVDHVMPLAAGGDPLDPHTLRPAHRGCNGRKSNKLRYTKSSKTSRVW
jgi:5-methylcytosine-specific restriction endonuclease McrA